MQPLQLTLLGVNEVRSERVEAGLNLGAPRVMSSELTREGRLQGPPGQLQILVAEDDPRTQRLLVALLDFVGLTAVIARDGSEALEAWRSARWDLILMDVRMPLIDGCALTGIIRRTEVSEGLDRVPIVAITAGAAKADQEACLAAGMDAVVSKPFAAKTLFEVIERYCGALAVPSRQSLGVIH
ncbi:response regulator [Phenylobacterium sp.]|uniref:response regulator n=1 Tax=Phenylobacterium sp. TaxID=1871053 RepID=UPI002731A703|nr:response regulator [Phenylobacterium sp.]MDP1616764.1 response regulator [Phenylobacterium sp.]MDP1988290.1 response regulator [Phenylobacterium sp.]